MTEDNWIKCKFCPWRVRKYRYRADGTITGIENAWRRLDAHIEDEHWEEHAKITGRDLETYV